MGEAQTPGSSLVSKKEGHKNVAQPPGGSNRGEYREPTRIPSQIAGVRVLLGLYSLFA